jgi:small-conductance mechanosensitive channel
VTVLKKIMVLMMLILSFGYASDLVNSDDQDLSQQTDELLGTLTTLVGKKEKVVDKTGDVKVKINDLKDAVKLLENKTERTKVIKVLSALALLKQEADKKQGAVEYLSTKITGAIEITTEAVINSVKLLTKFPENISTQISYLEEDEGYRSNTYILIMILLTAVLSALIAEFLIRRFFIWTGSTQEHEYQFRKLHLHIVRNTAPVIFFGLVGYLIIHFSQPEANLITFRGYKVMNFIMMLRTMWLLLKVLFVTRPSSKASSTGFQFTLAGVQTVVIGLLFSQVGYYMGMREVAIDNWLKIIGFGVISLLIIAIHRNKSTIKDCFKPDEEHLSGAALLLAKLIEVIFKKSPHVISMLFILSFALWLVDLDLVARFLALGLIKTMIAMAVFLFGRDQLYLWLFHRKQTQLSKISPETHPGLTYIRDSSTNILQLIWHGMFVLTFCEIWGADPIEIATSPDVQPYISKAISVVIILVIIRTLWGWSDHIAQSHIRGRLIGKKLVESSQFVKTVTPILNSVAHWVLAIMAIILILVEFGQDVRPMLYSLGVIGIAISLGAQSLVKDIINGILTLMEGNIAVGEVVTIGANTGTVESLSLRSVVLRHFSGALQTIPFSEVTNIINKSRDYTSYGINFAVPHRTDPTRAIELLNQTFADIKADAEFGKMILADMVITGVDTISDTGVTLTGFIKIKPDPKNRFGRAFNKYLQQRMEQADLYPPASQMYLNISN